MSRQSDSNSLDPTLVEGIVVPRPVRHAASAGDVERLERLARLLDDAIRIPGTKWRFGLDSLLGLVPGVGDLIGAILAGYILKESARLGANRRTLARMAGNIAFDFALGTIPVLGDVFDVAFKANRRNVRLLKKHLEPMEPPS